MAAAAAVVSAGLLLAACGGGGSSSNHGGGAASSGVVVQAGQGARLSGNFEAIDMWGWVPTSLYPSDITESSAGSYNTNDSLKVNKTHDLASMSCAEVLNFAGAPGYGEEAYLTDSGNNAAGTNLYGYGVYEFPTAAQASAFVTQESARFASCGTFSANESGTQIQATLSDGPVSDAQVAAANTAADVRLTASAAGKTNAGDLLLAADGNIVVAVSSSTLGSASLPTEVQNSKIAETLLTAFAKQEAIAVQASAGQASQSAAAGAGGAIRLYSTDAASSARLLAAVGGGLS